MVGAVRLLTTCLTCLTADDQRGRISTCWHKPFTFSSFVKAQQVLGCSDLGGKLCGLTIDDNVAIQKGKDPRAETLACVGLKHCIATGQ